MPPSLRLVLQRAFVISLDLPRENCWTIAEHAGDASPDGMQHLLSGAVWDADAVRDDVRGYVIDHLGDPEAVLVIDETGDRKKGSSTVGVALVKVGRDRVAVEESFQASKGLCGLDEHQVRCWRSWYRWVTLAMLADAFWSWSPSPNARSIRHPGRDRADLQRDPAAVRGLVLRPIDDWRHRLRWSWWRRRHQARARRAHDQRQAAQQP